MNAIYEFLFYFYFLKSLKCQRPEIVFNVIEAIISMSNLFVFCYFGALTTELFFEFGNYLYGNCWYELPIDLQNYVALIIINAQRPLNYHGSHIVYLNLKTFTKVRDNDLVFRFSITNSELFVDPENCF